MNASDDIRRILNIMEVDPRMGVGKKNATTQTAPRPGDLASVTGGQAAPIAKPQPMPAPAQTVKPQPIPMPNPAPRPGTLASVTGGQAAPMAKPQPAPAPKAPPVGNTPPQSAIGKAVSGTLGKLGMKTPTMPGGANAAAPKPAPVQAQQANNQGPQGGMDFGKNVNNAGTAPVVATKPVQAQQQQAKQAPVQQATNQGQQGGMDFGNKVNNAGTAQQQAPAQQQQQAQPEKSAEPVQQQSASNSFGGAAQNNNAQQKIGTVSSSGSDQVAQQQAQQKIGTVSSSGSDQVAQQQAQTNNAGATANAPAQVATTPADQGANNTTTTTTTTTANNQKSNNTTTSGTNNTTPRKSVSDLLDPMTDTGDKEVYRVNGQEVSKQEYDQYNNPDPGESFGTEDDFYLDSLSDDEYRQEMRSRGVSDEQIEADLAPMKTAKQREAEKQAAAANAGAQSTDATQADQSSEEPKQQAGKTVTRRSEEETVDSVETNTDTVTTSGGNVTTRVTPETDSDKAFRQEQERRSQETPDEKAARQDAEAIQRAKDYNAQGRLTLDQKKKGVKLDADGKPVNPDGTPYDVEKVTAEKRARRNAANAEKTNANVPPAEEQPAQSGIAQGATNTPQTDANANNQQVAQADANANNPEVNVTTSSDSYVEPDGTKVTTNRTDKNLTGQAAVDARDAARKRMRARKNKWKKLKNSVDYDTPALNELKDILRLSGLNFK